MFTCIHGSDLQPRSHYQVSTNFEIKGKNNLVQEVFPFWDPFQFNVENAEKRDMQSKTANMLIDGFKRVTIVLTGLRIYLQIWN